MARWHNFNRKKFSNKLWKRTKQEIKERNRNLEENLEDWHEERGEL